MKYDISQKSPLNQYIPVHTHKSDLLHRRVSKINLLLIQIPIRIYCFFQSMRNHQIQIISNNTTLNINRKIVLKFLYNVKSLRIHH